MKKSLIVGMGIGSLYKSVLERLSHVIYTVDLDASKSPDFTSIDQAIESVKFFDTVHICTPNFTHGDIARKLAPYAKIVFVEKPGVSSEAEWRSLTQSFPTTRFMLVKNNMWREILSEIRRHLNDCTTINIRWINKNRIPNPGTWFTTKDLAFGGVSRDLMPHLLSLYISLNDSWQNRAKVKKLVEQRYTLDQVLNTDYGVVNPNGVYDVDDFCLTEFISANKRWKIEANWADGVCDNRSIELVMKDGVIRRFDLGLCPEIAYQNMIADAVANLDNDAFWEDQLTKDLWIHKQLEAF